MTQEVTKTFKIVTSPTNMARIERFLTMLHLNSAWGHSAIFGMHLDGDGPDTVAVDGINMKKYRPGVQKVGGIGCDVEIANTAGFHGLYIDRDRSTKSYNDDGTERTQDDG